MNTRNKLVNAVIFSIIITISIVVGVMLVKSNQDFREKAAPLTSLFFSQSPINVTKNQTINTVLKTDTGTNNVTGIDIELVYNPAVIQINSITPTNALSGFTSQASGSVIKNEINNTIGNARFIAYTFDKTRAITGAKNLLNISLTTTNDANAGQFKLDFGSHTMVASVNESQNSILNKTPLILNLTIPTPTATATVTATPTQTAIPTQTPTILPTILPTATPIVYADWDVDQNTFINVLDIGIVVDNYDLRPANNPRADVDKDGNINIIDIGIIIDHYI